MANDCVERLHGVLRIRSAGPKTERCDMPAPNSTQ
jgi:hypothetical protein